MALTFTLEPVDPARDAAMLHAWVTAERGRFWMMADHTVEEVREVYQWIADQPTHAAYLVRADGRVVALFQTYDPRAEEIGDHYEYEAGDIGVHLMMAPADPPVHGLTAHVMDWLEACVFADPAVRRIVAEPDAANDKIQRVIDARGVERERLIRLDRKTATLLFVTREDFERIRRR
ncbi:GNAT family N-acetyltransferase [Nocardioides sp. R-C-SC26]|uniref:GNAT family N-acetyltransferase n=1 Tax=Nocardioides sp. R-C-SC26 TaxID=2870414 RepID=UPI001E49E9DE|nr:GNAT family N-acetyltransferase [Nocardioides sp. R-C-SC26]